MLRHRLFLLLALACAGLIAACGGGGGGSSPIPNGGASGLKNIGAAVRVLIPKSSASSTTRKPAFISPSTATITISVYTVNGATPSPTSAPVSIAIATSPDCTAGSSGTVCTITVTVPVATAVVLQISSYDASGNLLGQGLIGPINTTLATIPVQAVSVGGVPATIVLTPSGLAAGDDGAPHPIPFAVSALDAAGNTIIPPGAYPAPITLSISGDTNGALSLSTTTVASPGPSNGASTVTLLYNSALAITQATITAKSGSITASVPFAPIVFTPTSLPSLFVGGSMQTVTVSEAGYGGAFNVPGASSTTATVTCVPSNCTPSTVGGSVTIDVAPGSSAGTESVSVIDANGGFANIPITVTQSGGGGELVAPSYSIYEYSTQSGGTNYGITVGPDGQTLWFLDQHNAELGSVSSPSACSSSCGTIAETNPFYSPPPAALQYITAASDGNLYIGDMGNVDTEDYGGEVLQVTCSGATCSSANSLSLPLSPTPQPGPVLAAPDGNLYVASLYPNPYSDSAIMVAPIIGCCPSMSYLSIASPPSSVNGMTVDASGQNLWFTDSASGNVGYFPIPCSGSCTVAELPSGGTVCQECGARHRPLPHPNTRPVRHRSQCCGSPFAALNGIVSAPDGYLYVAETGANEIDRLSPSVWENCIGESCIYTSITLPNASALPQNLTIGPDGNVWFTDTTGYVGFVSLSTCASGTCKAFEYHVGGSPWGITSGPDGDIWFTDSSTNKIGKVVL